MCSSINVRAVINDEILVMNVSPAMRRKARHYAMQSLYQWHMAGASLNVIEAEYKNDNDMSKVDVGYFHELLHNTAKNLGDIEALFGPHLQERSIAELDPITMALLRMSTYELKYRLDVPYKVVINESVTLAKKFGATDAHKFINGVLDCTAADARKVEVAADRKR